jgi:hypothetical protein
MSNGIYEIRLNNDPIYVGESRNIEARCKHHRMYSVSASEWKYHGEVSLWHFLGEQIRRGAKITYHAHQFNPDLTKADRLHLERARILELQSSGVLLPFNSQHKGHSASTRAILSREMTGKPRRGWTHTAETKAAISASMTGNTNAARNYTALD